MTTFSVLDRDQLIHKHLFLEASAGTGKTFAIEHIFTRLLIESPQDQVPMLIENILVVTFTRAATRELKERIRKNLEMALEFLRSGKNLEGCPDYLLKVLEQGDIFIRQVKGLIKTALASFDLAEIHTIHGFCWKMLTKFPQEARVGFSAKSSEEGDLSDFFLRRGVRDFLKTRLIKPFYSTGQLKILMNRVQNDEEVLISSLVKEIEKGLDVFPSPNFLECFLLCSKEIERLKKDHCFFAESIISDLQALAENVKGLHSKNGVLKKQPAFCVEFLASLLTKNEFEENDFEIIIEDVFTFIEAFDEENLKVKKKKASSLKPLFYPTLLEKIKNNLKPILKKANDSSIIFSRVVLDCKNFLKRYQEEANLFQHQDILIQMKKSVAYTNFSDKVKALFSCAIIDEFQDTDPLQWKIFSSLFLEGIIPWKGFFHVVGDPKQSIYAFRQADIYTYLAALNFLGTGAYATLDTNYRSRKKLVDALNTLFKATDSMFLLPRTDSILPLREVHAGRKEVLEDKEPALHFIGVEALSRSTKSEEEVTLFQEIGKTILRLKQEKLIPLSNFAILVSDRYQADRIGGYLKSLNISVKSQRGKDLKTSSSLSLMKELIEGILNYKSQGLFNKACGGRIIGMNHQEIKALEDEEKLIPLIEQADRLKKILIEKGFYLFYQEFMKSFWHEDKKTVLEKLLSQEEGIHFFREWQDLADMLIKEERDKRLSKEGLLNFLEEIKNEQASCERVTHLDLEDEGVTVLTIHLSKGLEFEVVFAMGLTSRHKTSEEALLPIFKNDVYSLYPRSSLLDLEYRAYCEEVDAEKMRQLYVAMTRAKRYLYVPITIEEKQKRIDYGTASAIDILLAKQEVKGSYTEMYEKIFSQEGAALKALVSSHPSLMTFKMIEKPCVVSSEEIKNDGAFQLICPKTVSVSTCCDEIQSFTSLTAHKLNELYPLETIEKRELAPHEFSTSEKSSHTLPAGVETGLLLHTLMENISFQSVHHYNDEKAFIKEILPFIKDTPFEAFQEVIASMVYRALKHEFIFGSDVFSLSDIPESHIYREQEFLYACDTRDHSIEGLVLKSGFMKGVIDLFFEYRGKYYILDWKSNWLGGGIEAYQNNLLIKVMQEMHYDIQASIYAHAIEKYLKLFHKEPFKDIFGGTIYLFMRGVGKDSGVFLC